MTRIISERNRSSVSNRVFILALLGLFSFGSELFAEQQEEPKVDDFFEMSMEELMEMPIVVSSSRQEQKMNESSIPVSVVTAEDIHYSGATNIPEILQFVPGVDVRKIERGRYVVGVRGLMSRISDRTLVLINGRYAGDSVYGGMPDWLNLPVLMEDIQRIEVIRGPVSAAWGANAFNGVINIITKKPTDVPGGFASTTISEFGDSYTHLRYGAGKGPWSWRLSTGYENIKDSDAAGAGDYYNSRPALNSFIGFSNYTTNDFMRNWRFDFESEYAFSEQTKGSFGLAYSTMHSGSHEFSGYYPLGEENMGSLTRSFARIDHEFENGDTGYLQWSGNFLVAHMPYDLARYTSKEHRLEGQLNFDAGNGHHFSAGGDIDLLRANADNENVNESVLAREPFDELWGGAFLIDRFEVNDRLTLEGQIRGDLHSENDKDWSTRVSALYSLDDAKDHILRVSAARAFRTPGLAIREATKTSLFVDLDGPGPNPPFSIINILPLPRHLSNEEIWSYEVGYTGKLNKNVMFSANAYYQQMENLIGTRTVRSGPANMIANNTFENINGARNIGFETELAYVSTKGKISAWYAHDDFASDEDNQTLRALKPAENKAGLTGRLFLPDGWALNANCVVNSKLGRTGDTLVEMGASDRVDFNVSKTFADKKGELMIGVLDLFNRTNEVNADVGELTGHETPGRTFFARLQLKF